MTEKQGSNKYGKQNRTSGGETEKGGKQIWGCREICNDVESNI